MIKSVRNHGISITFDSGFTVTIIFGKHDSCNRYNAKDKGHIYDDMKFEEVEAFNAEVVVTDHKGAVVVFDGDTSLKYQTPKLIADVLFRASIAKIGTDMHNFDLSHIQKTDEWE